MNIEKIRGLVEQAMLAQALWATATDIPTMATPKVMVMFKWPDVVRSLMDSIEGKEDAEKTLTTDLHDIIIYPLVSIGRAYIEFIRHKEIKKPPGMNLTEMEDTLTKLLDVPLGEITASQTSEKADKAVSIINMLSSLSNDLNEIKEFYDEDRNWRYN